MVKKTFKILRENPIIIIGYAIFIFVPIITHTLFGHFSFPCWLQTIYDFINNIKAVGTGIWYVQILINILLTILFSILFIIPINRYTAEIILGTNDKGWYVRAINMYWWRKILFALCAFVMIIPIVILMGIAYLSLLLPGPIGIMFGMIVFLIEGAVTIIYFAFITIGFEIVVVEDDFKQSLKNIFIVGKKYILKFSVLYVLGMGIILIHNQLSLSDIITSNIYLITLYSILNGITRLIVLPFTSVYNISSYIKFRDLKQDTKTVIKKNEEKLTLADKIRKRYQ